MGAATNIVNIALCIACIITNTEAKGSVDPRCPQSLSGLNWEVKYLNGKCYQFVETLKYWNDASDWCNNAGGHLAQIDNQQTQDFLVSSLRLLNWPETIVWIGAHRRRTGGIWKWTTGANVAYTAWGSGQPDNSNIFEEEECVTMLLDDNGKWHDSCCACFPDEETYICMYDAAPDPGATTLPTPQPTAGGDPRCPQNVIDIGWQVKYFNAQCYQFVESLLYWNDASDYCNNAGGRLAQINDQQTQDFLVSTLRSLNWPETIVWIGAHRRSTGGIWKWTDGARLGYTAWGDGQPDNSNIFEEEECAQMLLDDNGRWHDSCCACFPDEETYVCMFDPVGATTVTRPNPQPTTPVDSRCPQNIASMQWPVKFFGDKCYQFVETIEYWPVAKEFCNNAGGNLVQIDNQQTQDFLVSSVRSFNWPENIVWIGANRRRTGGVWKWSTGATVVYTAWATGQPDNTNIVDEEECAQMFLSENGLWHDNCCDCFPGKETFICMYNAYIPGMSTTTGLPTPPPTTPVKDPRCSQRVNNLGLPVKYMDAKCYQFVETAKLWTNARDYCQAAGGTLAKVGNQQTQDFLVSSLRSLTRVTNLVWIGAHRRGTDGVWVWTTGEDVTFTAWSAGQPDNNNIALDEECVEIYLTDNGLWHDACCQCLLNEKSFICMFDAIPVTTRRPGTNSGVTQSTNNRFSSTKTTSNTGAVSPGGQSSKEEEAKKQEQLALILGVTIGSVGIILIAAGVVTHFYRKKRALKVPGQLVVDNPNYSTADRLGVKFTNDDSNPKTDISDENMNPGLKNGKWQEFNI
ncbi:unnamed protein product [Owenia fusiformis]|uniref:C-type lectin domain-containing protein n=1 Tax=Owenia fusiformis TaxID=6347 RepID=A0A8S4N202_OWEFU|nr:unnamed protein product [Owenia fusiformis]